MVKLPMATFGANLKPTVGFEQGDQFLEDVILRRAFKVELDGIFREELAQFHPPKLTGARTAVKS